MTESSDPDVSFVVPAKDESAYLSDTLDSIRDLETDASYEVIVVDGGSVDETPTIATAYGARLVRQRNGGIGAGRHLGALRANGEWLAFVDADTTVRSDYLEAMLSFVREHDLDAATSKCRICGCYRGRVMQVTINGLFSRLERPILPGFNFFIRRDVYEETGGFPDVPNEDTAFSRALGRSHRTAYCPRVLVETSARRIRTSGLVGTLYHYLRLDLQRLKAGYG